MRPAIISITREERQEFLDRASDRRYHDRHGDTRGRSTSWKAQKMRYKTTAAIKGRFKIVHDLDYQYTEFRDWSTF